MLGKIKNNHGSGLVWALAVGSFLLIIVTGALTIALHYSGRSTNNNDARQAYLTARSGADLIAQEFIGDSDNAASIYSFLETNGVWLIPDVGFQDDLGTCMVTVTLEDPEDEDTTKRTIQIESTATVNDEISIIHATIVGVIQRVGDTSSTSQTDGETLTWYLSSYTDGQE